MGESEIIQRVLDEVAKQEARWGEQNHHAGMWTVVLAEELGEVAKAALNDEHENFQQELIQVAAVCVSALKASGREVER